MTACGGSLRQLYTIDLAGLPDVTHTIGSLLGRWSDQPSGAGLLARALSVAMARTHLAAGHDVIIPQYVGVPAFLEQLEQLAAETGAAFHELVLLDSGDNTLRRFQARAATTGRPAHLQAHQMLQRAGGLPALGRMHDSLLAVIAARPRARVIASTHGHAEQAYQALLRHLTATT